MKKITNADVEALIQPTRGNMASIARHLGVTRSAISMRVLKSENLTKLIEEARESMIDDAESSLYRQVLEGNTTALIFFLKTQGHRRGYTEKQQVEHSGPDGGAIPIQYVDYRAGVNDSSTTES